ncbi:hypothetical protein ACFY5D_03690 [Paeniglutamicibacter sp. NPDC012692]|uniref:hypothetical protein n=1 Tax=Paeniglutamicibacter sp. NPDC012692 TaxID=3364388 RepID=UPI0036A5C6CF
MVDPNALTDLLLAKLRSLPDIGARVYDGIVPAKVPTDPSGQYIRPYVAVFSGLGSDLPGERDLTGLVDVTVLDWAPQTTVVGPDARSCRQAAQQVAAALTNLPMGSKFLMPDADAFRVTKPLTDSQVTPARAYLPLQWRLTTN